MITGKDTGQFQEGLTIGGAIGVAALVAVYALLAPTEDIRARIPFLLNGIVAHLVVAVVFVVIGCLALLALRLFTGQRTLGVAAAGAVCTLLLTTGAVDRLIPAFETSVANWTMAIAAAAAAVIVVALETRRGWLE